MSGLLQRLQADQRGFTIIEMMVVILIMGILAMAAMGFMTTIFNQQIAEGQRYEQSSNRILLTSVLSQRLNLTSATEIGLAPTSGTDNLDPLTVAGDQLIFMGSDDRCHRLFYVERLEEIKVASDEVGEGCNGIRPVRGPNEKDENGDWITAQLGDPNYDRVLDNNNNSFVVASQVSPDRPANNSTGPDPLRFLSYRGAEGDYLLVQPHAQSPAEPFYQNYYATYDPTIGVGNIYFVPWTAYLRAKGDHAYSSPITASGTIAIEQ